MASPGLPDGAARATVAAGCFWGVEHAFRQAFAGKGLLDARVGFTGGTVDSPSYRAVCNGDTGHAEACLLIFDPARLSYRRLLEFFYSMHDPTTANRQGNDRGSQYRSAIFYNDAAQKTVADTVTRLVNDQWWGGRVVTTLEPAGPWWPADDYHQDYMTGNPGAYQCSSHYDRQFPALKE